MRIDNICRTVTINIRQIKVCRVKMLSRNKTRNMNRMAKIAITFIRPIINTIHINPDQVLLTGPR